ncbi:uncharacterized protein N7506_003684 [Penicillium brevicompactum]|uniref:uncharacterized protein n=1 Tax=Penicillium brevicompactum TaxID=5074 RepID=UPI002541DAAC|nr:uncharacterized protein N7506_003684 [Penicillium brevicompactum]KAJ5343860.1 hypothetical protein N7506_003684 [Penicillium brevicompactum]
MQITHLSDLTPPSQERTWLTSPHPTLPLLATCSSDKTVRIYSLTNFTLLSTITGGHKRSVRTAAWKPHISGESVLATGSFDATVGIWRRWDNYGAPSDAPTPAADEDENDENEEWRFAVLLDGHDSEVKSVSWSASGMLLATCSRDKSIWIWEDLDDGDNNFETVAVMQEHGGDVKCVSWHPSEECLASGSYDDTIRIWREDLDDWGQVACLKGHEGTVWFLDWERDVEGGGGARLVSCSDDQSVRVWKRRDVVREQGELSSASTGIPSIIRPVGSDEVWEEEAVLPKAHELAVYAVAWSKTSGLVASVGADGRIALYEERVVEGDGAHGIYEINHIAWAKRADRGGQEEEVLVSTADDGSVKVWTLQ